MLVVFAELLKDDEDCTFQVETRENPGKWDWQPYTYGGKGREMYPTFKPPDYK